MNKVISIITLVLSINHIIYADMTQDIDVNEAFNSAVEKGDYDKVKSLIEKIDNIDSPGSNSLTPLMNASEKGYLNIVRLFIEKGANVNAKDSINEYTPLHFSAKNGHVNVVNLLLENGADPNIKSKSGDIPSEVAQRNGHNEVITTIENYKNNHSFNTESESEYLLSQAQKIIMDPNEILGRLKRYDDLVLLFQGIEKTGQLEESAWLSRRTENSSRIISALKRQLTSELELIEDTAINEDANKIAELSNDIKTEWTDTLNTAFKELRLKMRQEKMDMEFSSADGTERDQRRRKPQNREENDNVSESNEANILSEREDKIQENAEKWVNLGPSNFREFSETIHNQLLEKFTRLHNSADQEKAQKTLTVIDNILLSRHLRYQHMIERFEDKSNDRQNSEMDMQENPRRGRGRSSNEQDNNLRNRRR